MIRVPTFGVHTLTQSQMLETQSRLIQTQIQVSSGKVSESYSGIAIDSRRLVNLENAVTEAQGFVKNIDVTESRLALMESSISGVFDVAARFRDLLVNALNTENASLITLPQRVEDMLGELANALNVKQDGRFLFSGSIIDTAPVDLDILLSPTLPLVDAAEFSGAATSAGTGITGITGITRAQVDSGATGDAFQLTFDNATNTFTATNLANGETGTYQMNAVPAPGQTTDITIDVGPTPDRLVLTIDENFNLGVDIVTDTISSNVAGGLGAFGVITLTGTSGDISKIDARTIETSGTAAAATLTLSSTDGNFVTTTPVDLTGVGLVPVTLTNVTTGATITLDVNVAVGLDDAAIGDNSTEIRLDNFLRNVAATDGSVNVEDARPGDPGYDSANPGYYRGDNIQASSRIDANATSEYGIMANEPGIEKLVRALYTALNTKVTSGSIDRNGLETALGLAVEAMTDVPDIRSKIGSDRGVVELMKSRHQDFILFSQDSIGQIENVDITAAITRISAEQTQLEASFLLTSRLSQLSLVNFLR